MPDPVANLARWIAHPDDWVRDRFHVEPDPWQAECLARFPTSAKIAIAAAKGAGKTTLEAWLIWHYLSTRPHCRGAATSITRDNLRDNLWAELALWRDKDPLLCDQFDLTAQRVFHREHPQTWFIAARAWPREASAETQAATLAGLHADRTLFVIDESGGVPDPVVLAAEASLSTGKEGHVVQVGNTLRRSGPLWRASQSGSDWDYTRVTGDPDDPLRAPRISAAWARSMIAQFGADNPWVRVSVFGEFPTSDFNALISHAEVAEACARSWRDEDIAAAPRILGVDVARYGGDASCIARRQGLRMLPAKIRRSLDSVEGASWVASEWNGWDARACFVDDTGGYGAGWVDQLRVLGHAPVGVGFARKADDQRRFFNKRAEMYQRLVEWIRAGGSIPKDSEIARVLPEMQYAFRGDAMLLEAKEQIKLRLGHSPDETDAAALTFAAPVAARRVRPAVSRWVPQREPSGDYGWMAA